MLGFSLKKYNYFALIKIRLYFPFPLTTSASNLEYANFKFSKFSSPPRSVVHRISNCLVRQILYI